MPDEKERRLDLLKTVEARRHQADTFAWAVPGLAIAAQAFLLSTALAPSTEPLGRLLAAIAGIAALAGAMHLLVKQTYHFDLYEAVIERERQALELDSVQLDGLRELEFPPNTQFVKAGWREKPHLIWAIKLKARRVWTLWVFGSLLLIDVALAVYSLLALVYSDPGWL